MADEKANAFGIMLEDLMSRIPDPSTLQRSDNLLAFIRRAGQTTYPELQKVAILLTSGSAVLRCCRTVFSKIRYLHCR
jgi:hypothetical protein